MESRLQLYNRILSERDELKEEFVSEASGLIQKKVLLMEEFRTSRRVGLYYPCGKEVRTDLLFHEGDKNRKELYYPAMCKEVGGLAYFRIVDLAELTPAENGKMQPTGKQSRLRDLNNLIAVIVPGVAFDLGGQRMGLGKGFYDKSLTGFRGVRVALAYDFQIVAMLPQGSGGKKVDWIVTEKRIIRCQ